MPTRTDNLDQAPRGNPRVYLFIAAGAIAIGAALRIFAYARGVSMWTDEVMLALNIGRRGFGSLLAPLAFDQVAPPLYLWVTKAITLVGGMNEWSLRLLPLVAGIATPFMVWRVGRRIAGGEAALVAAVLAALSPYLIEYSVIVKPYGLDACVALALVSFACDVRDDPVSARRWRSLAIAGALAPLLSFAALYTLVAVVLFLATNPAVRASAPPARLAIVSAAWVIAGTIAYVAFMQSAVHNQYLHDFWARTFLTPGQRSGGSLRARVFHALEFALDAIPAAEPLTRPRVILLPAALGLYALVRQRGASTAVMCTAGVAAAFGAAALGVYPPEIRFLLFSTPFIFLVIGAAVTFALSVPERRWPGVTGLLALAVVPFALGGQFRLVRDPLIRVMGRDAIATLTQLQNGEPVYVSPGGIPAWTYYRTDWSHPDHARLDSIARIASAGGVSFFNAPRRGHVVVDEGQSLAFDDPTGRELMGVRTGGHHLALLDLEEPNAVAYAADPGWAANEAARVLALCPRGEGKTGTHYAWVFSAHRVEQEAGPLLDALSAAGARIVYRYDELQAVAVRIRLPERAGCT